MPRIGSNGMKNVMDKAKKKCYGKMAKRMYGGESDSDEDWAARGEEPVELKPNVAEFPTLHRREEEYFYDMFAFPWEKDKHYTMVYQLEKKYFPDHCLDKVFIDAGPETPIMKEKEKRKKSEEESDERGLMFFEKEGKVELDEKDSSGRGMDVSENKVEGFFKCLKKVPSGSVDGQAEWKW